MNYNERVEYMKQQLHEMRERLQNSPKRVVNTLLKLNQVKKGKSKDESIEIYLKVVFGEDRYTSMGGTYDKKIRYTF